MEPKKRSTSDLALAISLTAGGVIGLIVFWQMGIAFRSRAMRWEAIIGGAALVGTGFSAPLRAKAHGAFIGGLIGAALAAWVMADALP